MFASNHNYYYLKYIININYNHNNNYYWIVDWDKTKEKMQECCTKKINYRKKTIDWTICDWENLCNEKNDNFLFLLNK